MSNANGRDCGHDHQSPDYRILCWAIGGLAYRHLVVCKDCVDNILLLINLPTKQLPDLDGQSAESCCVCGDAIADSFVIIESIPPSSERSFIKRICGYCARPILPYISAEHKTSVELDQLPTPVDIAMMQPGGMPCGDEPF